MGKTAHLKRAKCINEKRPDEQSPNNLPIGNVSLSPIQASCPLRFPLAILECAPDAQLEVPPRHSWEESYCTLFRSWRNIVQAPYTYLIITQS